MGMCIDPRSTPQNAGLLEPARPREHVYFYSAGAGAAGTASDDDVCPICQDTLKRDSIYRSPCGHRMHLRCAARWTKRQNEWGGTVDDETGLRTRVPCPVCRTDLDPRTKPLGDAEVHGRGAVHQFISPKRFRSKSYDPAGLAEKVQKVLSRSKRFFRPLKRF